MSWTRTELQSGILTVQVLYITDLSKVQYL
uniref:Uncharacterized protein n=1 Tax=Anguilla anguilla TaxID=7936 RepID=A0A0E9REU7_ANGAN